MTVHMNPWQEVGPGSASGGGISNTTTHSTNPETAIAPDGTPYVVWDNFEGYPSTDHRIYIRRWNGSHWEEAGLGSASGMGISGTTAARDPSLAVSIDGTVYAAWRDHNFDGSFLEIYARQYYE